MASLSPDKRKIAAELVRAARRLVDLADDVVAGRASMRRPGSDLLRTIDEMFAVTDRILGPIREIARLGNLMRSTGTMYGAGDTDELRAEIVRAHAYLSKIEAALRPKQRGRKGKHGRLVTQFPRWRLKVEEGKKQGKRGVLTAILRREMPGSSKMEQDAVRKLYERWVTKMDK
jgi:hypothetical protein